MKKMEVIDSSYLTPDIDPGAIAEAREIAELAYVTGSVVAVRRRYGDDRLSTHVSRYNPNLFVVRDSATGLVIKYHPSAADAVIQQRVMNGLYERLSKSTEGVSAVRHPIVVTDGGQRGVSVIEMAPGESLRGALRDFQADYTETMRTLHAHVDTVETRLDRELGRYVSRTLVNDLRRGNNLGGNVFIDEDGNYTLIDQPCLRGKGRGAHPFVWSALELLERGS
ncbi:hypothetical protein L336_0051 [Candidatus Saccharimonas aalborgensis]|uniref:Aminoglycoside phosphotransferase domain-containing protein n=1 Tax=Candidatus Saccharimonas aalborgensis TaxID=1332188 RepID=R4PVK1_9BACT|nr:hypothetical protein [Candidatus Saccharimonas aalborgensis]AGL61762.1 hypothetical protein L336_0051 [Candidatus Saccharimonas aalborgensis]QQR51561.1 MAG: hypothetical protein IPF89_01880 [Candidatus Saccharibacteria bacterium]QQS68292.1 MAG: hypothetical protein IPP24_04780 [Candidatus Saccharibacteria bacterium]QQS70616.1 MAG: hypothetical protein IPP92_04785 [Candidatus Saccharibacteria bacterium]